jgi:pimeloyl-ACP methyl ester carboxylesterase
VLVHGFPLAGWMWDAQAEPLAARRRVLIPDLRGFGRSPLPPDPAPTIDDYADDLVALLDARGLVRATFAGLSMGGYVLLSLAERHPGRISGLVFSDTRATAD